MTRGPRLLDVNLLMALGWPSHVHHHLAQEWFGAVDGEWMTTPFTETGFARLSMNPAVVGVTVGWPAVVALLRRMRELPGHRRAVDDGDLTDDAVVARARIVGHRQVGDVLLTAHAARLGGRRATLDGGLVEALAPEDRSLVELLPASAMRMR